jgi:mono/diheme cytochrome c family protein
MREGVALSYHLRCLAKTTAAGCFVLSMFLTGCHRHPAIFAPASPVSAATVEAASAGSVDEVLEQGRYLAAAGNCISCHTRPGGPPYGGGLPFKTPLGTIYSSNITPDPDTGIGKWSEGDLNRALHEGIAADGRRLYPAFPYPSFTKIADVDVKAIYAYLKTLEPIRYVPPRNGIMFRLRLGMILWNALFFKPERYMPDTERSAEWNRGAYLVQGLGHCGACHTPRNLFMAEVSARAYAGGLLLDKGLDNKYRRWSAVNLTSSLTGLDSWSIEDIVKYLRVGFTQRGGTFGPMNDVIINSTRHMSTDDLRDIAIFLKGLPPQEPAVDQKPAIEQIAAGRTKYEQYCDKCHLASGRGGLLTGPRIQGSAVVQASDPASLINVILYGPDVPTAALGAFGGWDTMKPYKDVLSNDEVAAVSNYVRNSWGNKGKIVTARDVARQR